MTLTVVGGWYEEVCAEPHWYEIYGSGGRAAATVCGRDATIKLATYCPPSMLTKLQHLAAAYGFDVQAQGAAAAVTRFEYTHWLAKPQVMQGSLDPSELPTIRVRDDNILLFGLYEGNAVVSGKRVVYDPQNSAETIKTFGFGGSTATELVVVCNETEGRRLTGKSTPKEICETLLLPPSTKAVVLKRGWDGVYIATRERSLKIEPTPTERVHKIGTGDVYSAEFAYGWMCMQLNPFDAAARASEQVAYYTDCGAIPLPRHAKAKAVVFPPLPPSRSSFRYHVYIAGPFFNFAELRAVEELRSILQDCGLRVFSPYHDVGIGKSWKHIASADLEALNDSAMVFAFLDKYDPGTVFEVGYARAKGIPVVAYSPNLSELHSTMFLGSGCHHVRDFTTAVYSAVWWSRRVK